MIERLDSSPASGAWVFQAQAEITIMPSSEMAMEYADRPIAGAFVNVYVSANTLESSIARAREALRANRYQVIDFDWIMKVELDEWEVDDGEPSISELENLVLSDGYLFGRFHVYGQHDAH